LGWSGLKKRTNNLGRVALWLALAALGNSLFGWPQDIAGGASSLVGQMKTKSGRVVLFVILNQHGNVVRFRQNQDGIVAAIQNTLGGPAAFDYRPIRLSMRLADSDYEAAKARGEYEPRN